MMGRSKDKPHVGSLALEAWVPTLWEGCRNLVPKGCKERLQAPHPSMRL